MKAVRRVLVVGGGIGGMATAAALGQRGMDVVLIEKQATFAVPGVGLGQPANSLRVLRSLGVLPQVLEAGFNYDRMRYLDYKGELIVEHKFLLGGPGIPAVCALSRAELHAILTDAALKVGAELRLGRTVAALDQDPETAHVTFDDGTTEDFDLVVGFDGIRSTTRHFAFGEAFEPVPSGYGAWRIQVPRPTEIDSMNFYQGFGSKTGAMPLSEESMYLFHIRAENPAQWFEHDKMADYLRERLAGYEGYIGDIRDGLTGESDIVYSGLEPNIVPPPWNNGRVVLAGDAVHTFPPHLTQGAGMALEDGLVLADELAQDKPFEAQMQGYVDRRYSRSAFVYVFSMQMLFAEQMVQNPAQLDASRRELRANGSARIAASDRILNEPVISAERAAVV